jgi:hypothetical protein
MRRVSACGLAVSSPGGPNHSRASLLVSAHADAVKDAIDVNISNRYGPIRAEDAQADDFIRPGNPGSSNVEQLDLRSTGFF